MLPSAAKPSAGATLGVLAFGLLLAMAPWAGNCQGFGFRV